MKLVEQHIINNLDNRYSGRCICRGLYKSTSALINADVNGSLNILRKYY